MLNPRLLVAMLWQRRLLFIATLMMVIAGAATLIWLQPARYIAEALIAPDTRPLKPVQGLLSSQDAVTAAQRLDPTLLAGEINVLQSRSIAEKVIAREHLDTDPAFLSRALSFDKLAAPFVNLLQGSGTPRPDPEVAAERLRERLVIRFLKDLKVEIPKGSSQLHLAFTSTDPGKAAAVVNTLLSVYLEEQVAAKRSVVQQTLAQLRATVDEFRHQAVAAYQTVRSFREQNQLARTVGDTPLVQQVTNLAITEQKSRLELQEATKKLELLHSLGPMSEEAAAAVNGYSQDLASQLGAREAELRAKLAHDSSALGSLNPALAETRAQLKRISERLAARQGLTLTLMSNQVAVLQDRQAQLGETMQSLKSQLTHEIALEAQLDQLSNDARTKQAAYEEILAGYNRTLVQGRSTVPDMRVLYPAEEPSLPSPSKLPLVALSLPLALLAAAATVVVVHQTTSSRKQTAREFEGWSDIPVIGISPELDSTARFYNPSNYLSKNPLSDYAEAVRGVRNAIDSNRVKLVSIAVTSALPAEGKSFLSASLATAWAAAGMRTLLIDCDMRRPALPRLLQCDKSDGLADFLSADADGERLVQRNVKLGFDVMTTGPKPSQATYRFTRDTMRSLIDQFAPNYDRIILDLPPVLAVSDGAVGAAASDLTVFVSHWGQTRPEDSRSALEILRKLGVTEIRAVLSRVNRRQYADLNSVKQYSYVDSNRYEASARYS